MLPMRDDKQQPLKIELLSQWKLEAESRNFSLRGMQVVKSRVVKIQMHVAVGIKSHSTGFGYFDSGITFSSRLIFSISLIREGGACCVCKVYCEC